MYIQLLFCPIRVKAQGLSFFPFVQFNISALGYLYCGYSLELYITTRCQGLLGQYETQWNLKGFFNTWEVWKVSAPLKKQKFKFFKT